MIFAGGAQGTPARAAIVGQVLRDGEYQVQRLLHRGQDGKGWLFLALHTRLLIPVALKQVPADKPVAESILIHIDALLQAGDDIVESVTPSNSQEHPLPPPDGSAINLFVREALLLARLQHPAIPTLYDYFFEDGYWYLVIDYIPGQTLTTYLQQYGPLSALAALNCALQMCDTLDYLHSSTPAIVLRNLTPESIRVTQEGILVLTNFDLATYSSFETIDDEIEETAAEYTHQPGDTEAEILAYMPGELQEGARRNKAISSDIHSLGVILREMLYSKRTGPDGSSLDSEVQYEPSLSTYLSSLIRLATRSEPLDRFQSASTFSLALQRAYQIEEQRAFQEHLSHLHVQSVDEQKSRVQQEEATRGDRSPETGRLGSAQREQRKEDLLPGTQFRELEQRQVTRAAMQKIRRERLDQEQVELQLASVDEGLEQRASMSHSQISLQAIAQAETPTAIIPSLQRFQRLIKVNFVLALLLCLVLVSLLIYIRVAPPIENSLHKLIRHPISSTERSGELQNIPSMSGASKGESSQNPSGTNGNPVESYWQALPSLPAVEADNAMVYVELQGREYIYMNGGYHGSPAYDRSLYRYDIQAAHWETVDHFPGMVNDAAAVDEQGHLFFTTGYSSDTYTVSSQLSIYDPGTAFLKKVAPPSLMPLGFGGSILADRQGHLYISQGFLRAGDGHALAGTGWYRYDIGTAQWHQLSPLPVGLGYVFTASDDNGGILLMGGATDAGQHSPTNKIYRYDIASDSWTQATDSLPQSVSGAAGCQVRPGQFALVGGYDPTHDTGTRTTWLLDLHTLKWRSLADLTVGGSVLGAAACDGKGHLFLERGTNNPRVPTSDYWEMTVAPDIKIDN
jgi:serine/threonine protein kinase